MLFLGVLLVLILGVWILLWLVCANKKDLTPTQEFLLKTFISTLTIIGTVVASSIAATEQINEVIVDFAATISNYQTQTVNLNVAEDLDQSTVQQKLYWAEQAFDAGDFQKMMKIYSYNDTFDSSIRNNNYGYAYANGLYVDENLETAGVYFDKAISKGLEAGYANKFRALMCQQKVEEAAELLVFWSRNSEHEILNNYFERNVEDVNGISLYDFCSSLSKDEQTAVLKNLLIDEYLGVISTESPMVDTSTGGYIYTYTLASIDTMLVKDNTVDYDRYMTIRTYKYRTYKSSVVDSNALNIFYTIDS